MKSLPSDGTYFKVIISTYRENHLMSIYTQTEKRHTDTEISWNRHTDRDRETETL